MGRQYKLDPRQVVGRLNRTVLNNQKNNVNKTKESINSII